MQHANGVYDHIGIELGILVVGVLVADAKVESLRLAFGEVESRTAFQQEKTAVCLDLCTSASGTDVLGGCDIGLARRALGESVVALHEASRAANHE
jgi:hypothetical protein